MFNLVSCCVHFNVKACDIKICWNSIVYFNVASKKGNNSNENSAINLTIKYVYYMVHSIIITMKIAHK